MPQVNPEILVWARESAGFDLPTAAKKLSFRDSSTSSAEEKLQAFESGNKSPSRSLLIRMSKQYRRPLLTFYLQEIPRPGNRGEDYRVLSHEFDPSQNAMVDALVRNVRARQEIVKDALIVAQERGELSFVGSYQIDSGVSGLAISIADAIDFDLEIYRQSRNQGDAFKYLRECVESSGIFTLLVGNLGSHHTNLSTEIFRGFALADPVSPFIIINDQDAKSAWSMTMIHEVAHIWLGESGISGSKLRTRH